MIDDIERSSRWLMLAFSLPSNIADALPNFIIAMTSTPPTSQPITVQIHHTQQGTRLMIPSGQLSQLPAGFIQILQTSVGQMANQPSPSRTVAAMTSGTTLSEATTSSQSTRRY
jgi:hypothetical protein